MDTTHTTTTTTDDAGPGRHDALAALQASPDGLTASQLADALGGPHLRALTNQLLADLLQLDHVQRVPGTGVWQAGPARCRHCADVLRTDARRSLGACWRCWRMPDAPAWLPPQRTSAGDVPYLPAGTTQAPVPAWLRPGWDGTHDHAHDAWRRLCDLVPGPVVTDAGGCPVGAAVALYHLGAGHETAWGLALQGRPVGVLEMAGGPGSGCQWWAVARGYDQQVLAMLQDVALDACDLDGPLGRLAAAVGR